MDAHANDCALKSSETSPPLNSSKSVAPLSYRMSCVVYRCHTTNNKFSKGQMSQFIIKKGSFIFQFSICKVINFICFTCINKYNRISLVGISRYLDKFQLAPLVALSHIFQCHNVTVCFCYRF